MTLYVCPFDQHELDTTLDDEDPSFVGVVMYAAYMRDGVIMPSMRKALPARAMICPRCGFVALFGLANKPVGGAES